MIFSGCNRPHPKRAVFLVKETSSNSVRFDSSRKPTVGVNESFRDNGLRSNKPVAQDHAGVFNNFYFHFQTPACDWIINHDECSWYKQTAQEWDPLRPEGE